MSNTAIINRLETRLEDFLLHKSDLFEFSDDLMNSIDALEGIDYSIIQKARDFQYKFEIADFNDENEEIETLDNVVADFKKWLKTIKE
jgi:hypothetical protein